MDNQLQEIRETFKRICERLYLTPSYVYAEDGYYVLVWNTGDGVYSKYFATAIIFASSETLEFEIRKDIYRTMIR